METRAYSLFSWTTLAETAFPLISIQWRHRHNSLVIISHRYKSEPFAFLRGKVPHNFHVLHGSERAEKLPEDIFFGFRREIVDEDAPAAPVAR